MAEVVLRLVLCNVRLVPAIGVAFLDESLNMGSAGGNISSSSSPGAWFTAWNIADFHKISIELLGIISLSKILAVHYFSVIWCV